MHPTKKNLREQQTGILLKQIKPVGGYFAAVFFALQQQIAMICLLLLNNGMEKTLWD